MKNYLANKGVDIAKYIPIGVDFYPGEDGFIHIRFICKDKDVDKKRLVTIAFEKNTDIKEFLAIFKRFNVIVTSAKGCDYSDWDLDDDTIMIGD